MIWYGGDYNPEQWPEAVWDEDVRLMQQAGVNLVSLGIFSWAKLEPREGEFDFGWLDRIIDKLHAGGIRLDLATATASPPPWLSHHYPEVLPVTEAGVRLQVGSRQQYCPSSPIVRRLGTRLVRALAERYGSHPGLEFWHVNNEYGCHVARCYCDTSAAAFRDWLRAKYGTVDAVNASWGTAFWSQQYGSFDEIYPPSAAPTFRNPGELLDFDRFSSDELIECYRAEVAVLREVTPQVPITTNFMGFFKAGDYWKWAKEVDIVANDSYPDPFLEESPAVGAFSQDLMRSLRGGAPWLLMEQAPSAVNWRAQNSAKLPGQQRAWSYQAIARGAKGILFFQWRQSIAGAEKFHSGMLPHAGTDSRVWREIEGLGRELGELGAIAEDRVDAKVAIVFEWDSWRTIEQAAMPTALSYPELVFAWYRELWNRNVTVDFVTATSDLTGYSVVIAPSLFVTSTEALTSLAGYAAAGGQLVVTYQSGIVDENARVVAGGYLGELRSTLGIRIEEFAPFPAPHGEAPVGSIAGEIAGDVGLWGEYLHAEGATVVASFDGGALDGWPAITRRDSAWYVATQPGVAALSTLVGTILDAAGVAPAIEARVAGVEAVRRGDRLFLINHGSETVTVESTVLAPQGVAIIERA